MSHDLESPPHTVLRGQSREEALHIVVEELVVHLLEKVEEVEKTAALLRNTQQEFARSLKFLTCDVGVLESVMRSVLLSVDEAEDDVAVVRS